MNFRRILSACVAMALVAPNALFAASLPNNLDGRFRYAEEIPNNLTMKQFEYAAGHFGLAGKTLKTAQSQMELFDTDFPALYPMHGYATGENSKYIFEDSEINYFNEVASNAEWFVTKFSSNFNGNRILDTKSEGYLMDHGNAEWVEFISNRLAPVAERGYVGVLLDLSMSYGDFDPANWISSETQFYSTYPDLLSGFVRDLKETLGDSLLVLRINSLRNQNDTKFQYPYADGFVIDEFARAMNGQPLNGDMWLTQMENIKDLVDTDKLVVMNTAWDTSAENRLYVLASFYLLFDDHTFLGTEVASNNNKYPIHYPELDLDLGRPLGEKEEIVHYKDPVSNLYVRHFENGVVVVNTGFGQRIYTLDEAGMKRAYVEGGGLVDVDGVEKGSLERVNASNEMPINARTAMVFYWQTPKMIALPAPEEDPEETVEETTTEGAEEQVDPVTEEAPTEETPVEETTEENEAPEVVTDDAPIEEVMDTTSTEEAIPMTYFADVPESLKNAAAINFLRHRGVIQGYDDGTYKPYKTVNRAELLKILVEGSGFEVDESVSGCFPDVQAGEWYTPYVCYAKMMEWVEGYPDGTFQPARTVNKVEALKILAKVQSWADVDTSNVVLFSDVDSDSWYASYLAYAKQHGFLEEDGTVFGPSFGMNRGKIAEYIFRTMVVKELGKENFESSDVDSVMK